MILEYYSQDEELSPHWEENPDDRLVCPECGCDVIMDDQSLTFICTECMEDGLVSNLSCRVPITSISASLRRTG